MAKKGNRGAARKTTRPPVQGTANSGTNTQEKKSPAVAPAEVPKTTIEDVKASTSQADFEKKKEALIAQVIKDVEELEASKDEAEKAAKLAKEQLAEIEQRKAALITARDELQLQYDELQEAYTHAEETIAEASNKAKTIRDEADSYSVETRDAADLYADTTRKEADLERLQKVKEAADEARAAWQTEIDKLTKQIQELSERESALQDAKRQLAKEKYRIEDEKDELYELKEELQRQKARYDSANPAKLSALERELEDERSKYSALQDRYHDLAERLNALQVLMDTIKTEVEGPDGTRIASMNEIVTALQELRIRHEKLVHVYKEFPDDAVIAALKEKAQKAEALERDKEILERERNSYREQVVAARNAVKELETVKQEVEATNALNEHLLQELESHKTALESRTGDTCPSLTKVDSETEADDFRKLIAAKVNRESIPSLKALVAHVKNYAGSRSVEERLFYTDNDIRAFLAGMAVSRLIILQGMSGTGKSSLPRIFSEAISGFNRLIPVESSWRDRNELLGYYNDFNKKFNAKSFTIELYRSGKEKCQEIPTFIVLDEMNLARIEYYFSDFLAILQEPDHQKWLIELVSSDMRTLPMELPEEIKAKMHKEAPTIYSIWEKIERSRQGDLKAETSDDDKERLTAYLDKLGQLTGAKDLIDGRKIRVTDNIWFVGTANRDESTFEISDKVYDRAQVVSLNRKGKDEGNYQPTHQKYISVTDLTKMFDDAIKRNSIKKEVEERLEMLDTILMDKFDVSFGNRIVTQTINFAAVFVAAGGELKDALDYQISTKILRKVISSDDEEALMELHDAMEEYPATIKLIEKRIKELR